MPNPRFTPPFTSQQQKFLAICPKITSIPSIIGSIYMIQHILRSPQRRSRVYTRLLVGMSCMDCLYAFKCFLSTWIIPKSPIVYGSSGSTRSCSVWGFFGHGSSLSSALYNGSLTLYYLLTIRHGWTQSQFRAHNIIGSTTRTTKNNNGKRQSSPTSNNTRFFLSGRSTIPWEILLHLIPLCIGWGTAIATIPLKLMNPIGWTCWIGPWPLGCSSSGSSDDGGDSSPLPCARGENAKLYRWIFFHAILWITFAFVTISMILIWWKIKIDETISIRFSSRHNNNNNVCGGGGGGGSPHVPDDDSNNNNNNNNNNNDKPSTSLRESSFFFVSAMTLSTRRVFFKRPDNTHRGCGEGSDPFVRSGVQQQQQRQSTNTISNRRSRSNGSNNRMLLSKRFAQQAFYYVAAFFLAWIWPMAQFAVTNTPDGTLYYPLLALTVILNPFAGACNALIYLRPRYLRYRQKQIKQQQQQQQQKQKRQRKQQQGGGGGDTAAAVVASTRSSGEGSSNDFALGLSFRGRIQALVSAISVQGDDDEDDLSLLETSGSNGTPTVTATTATENRHHHPCGTKGNDGGGGDIHRNNNCMQQQQTQVHSTDEFEFDCDNCDDDCIVAVAMKEEVEEQEQDDDDDKLIEKSKEGMKRLQQERSSKQTSTTEAAVAAAAAAAPTT